MFSASHFRPRQRGRITPLGVAFALLALVLSPAAALGAQTSFSVTAWGSSGTGQLFDGVSVGLAHRAPGSVLYHEVASVPVHRTGSYVQGSALEYEGGAYHHPPSPVYGAQMGASCWDLHWDWWNYGWYHPCDPTWWNWGWAPVVVMTPVRVRPRPVRPFVAVGWGVHVGVWGGSWWAYDPWYASPWAPGYVVRPPRWRTAYVYQPQLFVVHPPPHRVVYGPPSHAPARGGISPSTGYKEHPGTAAPARTAVPRGAQTATAPAPDLRTSPSRTEVTTRTGAAAAGAQPPQTTRPADRVRPGAAAAAPPTRSQPPARSAPPTRATAPPPTRTAPPVQATPPTRTTPPAQATPPTRTAPPVVTQGTPPPTRTQPPAQSAPPTRATPPARTTPPTQQAPPARSAPPPQATPPTRATPPARTEQTPPPPQTRQAPPPAQTRANPPAQTRTAPPPTARSAPPPPTRSAPPPPTRSAPPPPRTGRGGG